MVDGYIYAGIPLETLVADSQYMDNDQDFTFSKDFPVDSMQARARPQALRNSKFRLCLGLGGSAPAGRRLAVHGQRP